MPGSSGGQLGGGNSFAARERVAPVLCGRAALWVVRFVLCILLICIIVVPVPFVCCSLKLPLSRLTSFLPVSFYSPPHTGRGRGSHVELLLPAAAKLLTHSNLLLKPDTSVTVWSVVK